MTDVFGRRYSLVIGRIGETVSKTVNSAVIPVEIKNSISKPVSTGETVTFDYRTEREIFTRITDLSMTADVVYTKSTANKGGTQNNKIELHNLSEETKARIREKDIIMLKAGYMQDIPEGGNEDALPVIFFGQIITKSTTRQEDGTRITSLLCGDNKVPKVSIKVSEAWEPGVGLSRVLLDLLKIAAANGIPEGKVFGLSDTGSPLAERIYTYGYSVSGNLFDEIQKICDSIDFSFYISMGKIFIEPKVGKLGGELFTIVKINRENLKKPIEHVSDGSESIGNNTREGIKLNVFLDGSITLEHFVQISDIDEDFNGTYQIKSIKHSLDFEGSDWDTIIECMRVG